MEREVIASTEDRGPFAGLPFWFQIPDGLARCPRGAMFSEEDLVLAFARPYSTRRNPTQTPLIDVAQYPGGEAGESAMRGAFRGLSLDGMYESSQLSRVRIAGQQAWMTEAHATPRKLGWLGRRIIGEREVRASVAMCMFVTPGSSWLIGIVGNNLEGGSLTAAQEVVLDSFRFDAALDANDAASPSEQPDHPGEPPVPLTKTCPRCAETVKTAATACRYCGHEFESS